MLEYEKIILQEIGGLEECRDSYQMREVVVHPYLGLPIDEVQKNVVESDKATTFSSRDLV